MWNFPKVFDVIVIGGGHAGCEAASASARMGANTLMIVMNVDNIAKPSCNPAIGGTAKGQIVREIDAMGGEMGKNTDSTAIHLRILNRSKGPAVRSPRAQIDKQEYSTLMKYRMESISNLLIFQDTVTKIVEKNGKVVGVITELEIFFQSKSVIITSGTFLQGLTHIGKTKHRSGRSGEFSADKLSTSLLSLGINLERLKTGTPPRILGNTIDKSKLERQDSEKKVRFSFFDDDPLKKMLPKISCWITYTSPKTHDIIRQNIDKSPLYSGEIQSIGPRYCPSIEDKVVKFPDRDRHQIFLEPEGLSTDEIYVNGISTSLPINVQHDILQSIKGLENSFILRPGYAIEYDYITSGQMKHSLESNSIDNLFFAGQINGTTGYEEAAAQGLLAGINAVKKNRGEEPLILKRSESYIGVLIDDIVCKEIMEPYRMFTSRAEYRLLLRQDNADTRLAKYGYDLGLISEENFSSTQKKSEIVVKEIDRISRKFANVEDRSISLKSILSTSSESYGELAKKMPMEFIDYGDDINEAIEAEILYAGYIQRQMEEIKSFENLESIRIPCDFDYDSMKSLKNESKEKLKSVKPKNLGQASRIAGVNPTDISALMIHLRK